MNKGWLSLVACVAATVVAAAQVPANVLLRTVRIRTAAGACTAFTIETSNAHYLVTARHCIGELRAGVTTLEWWQKDAWTRLEGPLVLPVNEKVDIAAIRLAKPITVDFPLEPTLDGVQVGQPVYFSGFPLPIGTGSRLALPSGFGELPFIKAGILSALDSRNRDAIVVYVDGQNNPGFSGGPITFQARGGGGWRVGAVVSGYYNEPFPVLKEGDLADPQAKAHENLYTRGNSGIVVGYAIEHIVQAINAAR